MVAKNRQMIKAHPIMGGLTSKFNHTPKDNNLLHFLESAEAEIWRPSSWKEVLEYILYLRVELQWS